LLDVTDILDDRHEGAFVLWKQCLQLAEGEFKHKAWRDHDPEQQRRFYQRARRHFINRTVLSAKEEVTERLKMLGCDCFAHAVQLPAPVVSCRARDMEQLQQLIASMLKNVYQSDLVARQNFKETHILRSVFEALVADQHGQLLPPFFRKRFSEAADESGKKMEIARYLASLSDRAVMDLHGELYDPRERAMGRRFG
jgi:dGTP triphosphohydrolase